MNWPSKTFPDSEIRRNTASSPDLSHWYTWESDENKLQQEDQSTTEDIGMNSLFNKAVLPISTGSCDYMRLNLVD
ncbi:hypothetical protein CEXT_276591 [Caerostris extrusa]|uniref:Uncharacterized protein n=1 Tax=Caerostris extrusa TaxID=172846 RepID=A0AAV4XD46_CAEEX|nr:hypothetical protein CEXT_276591 [Caerostris extrusa]